MPDDRETLALSVLITFSAVATLALHIVYVPEHFPENLVRALPSVLAGWLTFTLVFYMLGRLRAPTSDLPSMRTIDYGLGLVLFALLASGFLDTFGFTIQLVTEVHLFVAPVLYLGLALTGWGFGRRTAAVNRIAGEAS